MTGICGRVILLIFYTGDFGGERMTGVTRRVSEGSLLAGQTLGGSLTFTSKFACTTEFVYRSIPNPMNTSLP